MATFEVCLQTCYRRVNRVNKVPRCTNEELRQTRHRKKAEWVERLPRNCPRMERK